MGRWRPRSSVAAREQWARDGLAAIVAKAKAEHRDTLTEAESARADVLAAMLDGARRQMAANAAHPARSRGGRRRAAQGRPVAVVEAGAAAVVETATAALAADRESTRRYLQALAREGYALGQMREIARKARAEGRETLTAEEDRHVSVLATFLDGARQVQAALLASLAEQIEDSGDPRHVPNDRAGTPRRRRQASGVLPGR